MTEPSTRAPGRCRPVRCIETQIVYSTAYDAARAMGITSGSTILSAIHRGGTCASHSWEFAGPPGTGFKARPVEREDGIRYPSATAAAQALGVSRNLVSRAIRKGHRCKGFRWRWLEPGEEP